jgi:hypothetical protein
VVAAELWLGAVTTPSGTITDWRSVRARHRVFVRGQPSVPRTTPLSRNARFDASKAGTRRCETCGRDLYHGVGQRYIYPAPPLGAHICDADRALVLHADLAGLVSTTHGRDLRTERLDVLEAPQDGFGELTW